MGLDMLVEVVSTHTTSATLSADKLFFTGLRSVGLDMLVEVISTRITSATLDADKLFFTGWRSVGLLRWSLRI